jgi:hypothetical protein
MEVEAKDNVKPHRACPYCGWVPGRYVKYNVYVNVLPVEHGVKNVGDVTFQDRIQVSRMRKISQLRPKDREMYVRILEFLRAKKELAYSAYELRQLMIGLPDTKGMTKVLRWMTSQGMLTVGMKYGDAYYAWKE